MQDVWNCTHTDETCYILIHALLLRCVQHLGKGSTDIFANIFRNSFLVCNATNTPGVNHSRSAPCRSQRRHTRPCPCACCTGLSPLARCPSSAGSGTACTMSSPEQNFRENQCTLHTCVPPRATQQAWQSDRLSIGMQQYPVPLRTPPQLKGCSCVRW
jgi:hypothetical protein